MLESIKSIILEYAEPDFAITEDTLLKYDIGLSSFELICIASDISNRFSVKLDDNALRKCKTVGDLAVCTAAAAG